MKCSWIREGNQSADRDIVWPHHPLSDRLWWPHRHGDIRRGLTSPGTERVLCG